MVKIEKRYLLLTLFTLFILYLFIAVQPVPMETVLTPRWISSLESNYPVSLSPETPEADTADLFPFTLGNRFGYIGGDGKYSVNQIKKGGVSISEDHWAEYEAVPESIEVRGPQNTLITRITEAAGYPLFLDGKIFLVNDDQTALHALSGEGKLLWTYEFAAIITDVDAAAGLVLAGFLDGTVELLNEAGKRVFFFEPGGSRYPAIYSCRISRDGSKLAVIAGYDDQRFLFLERSGGSYKVAYHEFLSGGFNREVYMAFIDHDRRIVFEREGGLEIFTIAGRGKTVIPLEGSVIALDNSGEDRLLFVISSLTSIRKKLVGIRFPGTVIMEAPFMSGDVFLKRKGKRLYIGGGGSLASFELHRR
ncbi:MAG: WD40 repeat domain-containing protein [Treponema sp.]|jgi:hypothetical protein|nr:WD40 repeat domain-containing protein [Treponema sp.]